jgi:heme-degrading monooxygenase HmoA
MSYAVIFSSQRKAEFREEYDLMAKKMLMLAAEQPGFLSVESTRDEDGFGITVSYWESLEAIRAWRANTEHLIAQRLGRELWYENFSVKIAKVEETK